MYMQNEKLEGASALDLLISPGSGMVKGHQEHATLVASIVRETHKNYVKRGTHTNVTC